MKNIPGSPEVDRALATVEKRVQSALRKINRQAGRLLAKGDYDGSTELVGVAKGVRGFQETLDGVRVQWRGLTRGAKAQRVPKTERNPLWAYYQPLLKILCERDGDATRAEIEKAFEFRLGSFAKAGEHEVLPSGIPRWKAMVRRSRRPMIKEGFLDAKARGRWRITPLGRRAAEKETPTRS